MYIKIAKVIYLILNDDEELALIPTCTSFNSSKDGKLPT
jgi:hypothetical protein